MSSIEKLKITGIRSYSNVEPSIIEFYKPLTLIVGSNGAGKTSIIECLKYVTTGDMPPGSKNSYFVHDPKVAGEQEVKGQVKLLFTDITQKPVTVTRTLISTQKGKKTETRSLESVIKRDIQGERRGISSRCAEINHEMITNLGVSKAVLENVIFCHQEESNWPLSEGKVLKQKFDEIFAATRYIKALDAIRKLRQEKSKTVTMYETEMKYLKETKDKAQEITEELEKKEVKVQSTKDSIVKLTNSLIPVEKRLDEIDSVMQEVNDLTKEIDLLKSKKDHLYSMQLDLEDKISELFTGRTEELQRIYDEFQSKIGEKNNILQQKEDQHQRLVVEGQNLSKEQSRVSCEHGKLMQEAERHKKNLEERDIMVISLADHYTIPGYDNGPFEDTRVDSFVEELRKTYANIIEDTKQKKQMFHEKIQVVQAKIDDIKKTQAEYGETIRLKRNMMIDNQRELKSIGQELSNVDASANRLKSLETELVRTNKDLQEARDQGNVDDMNTEIDKLLGEKRQVDNELSRLRDEQQTMHMHSTTQAKLDMFMKDKHEKEDKIQKLMDKHEEDIKTYLGGTRTSESLIDKLRQYIRTKGKELSDTRNNLQRLKQALSAKNANKKNIEDQLTRKEEQANTYKQQLKEACGDNDYNTIKEHMKTEIDDLRDDKSMYASIEGIYKKYIDKLQHESVRDEGCPLCHRCFDSSKDIKALVAELNKKINTLPEKRRDNERRLESGEKRYQKILNLGPIKENLEKLESTEIQESKTRLEVILVDIENTEIKITELEDIYSITESEELTAKQMEPDLRDVETLKQELKDLDRNISVCQSKIHGIAPGRTMQAVTNEITDRQERSETLDRHIDRRRRALTQLQRQISTLESNLNDLKSQKLQLTERLQKRTHLENQKAELTAKNTTLEREIKDAEAKASPIQAMLIEEQNNKHEIDQAKEKMEDENRKMLNEIRTNGDKLRGKVDEIKRYISEGNDLELQDIERTLDNLTQREKKLFEEKSKISATIDTLKNDISKQEIKARDLEDNLKLKSIQNDIQGVDRSIQTVHADLRQYGDQQSLDSERGNLFRESQNLRKEKAHLEGIQKGHEDAIRGFQADLRSNMYRDAEVKYRDKMIEMKTTQMATVDLDKYYKALDRAIMKYHGLKMAEINKIIKEYWINTYRGNDIDTIEIRSDEEEGSGASKARRTYNYRVVMIKGDTILDMRGRCSAGQKVLASLIIRLALAETFCLNCGILTLDEPTTNLDEDNVTSLADQLASVIRTRHGQKNFQLIVITHDEGFVDILGRADFVDYYYRIYKDDNGKSKILRQSVASLNRTESYIE